MPDRLRPIVVAVALATLAALLSPAGASEPLYFELWQPEESASEETDPGADDGAEIERSQILLAMDQIDAESPIAEWCRQQRLHLPEETLPLALLREAPYSRFETGIVPLELELLIDDVELRYALGTNRPLGADGLSFPYFELCALGFGRRDGGDWSLDVVHLSNARGQQIVVGVYKGVLPKHERDFLAASLGYDHEQPDPAGILLLGQGEELPAMLLVRSESGEAFDALRRRIVR